MAFLLLGQSEPNVRNGVTSCGRHGALILRDFVESDCVLYGVNGGDTVWLHFE